MNNNNINKNDDNEKQINLQMKNIKGWKKL